MIWERLHASALHSPCWWVLVLTLQYIFSEIKMVIFCLFFIYFMFIIFLFYKSCCWLYFHMLCIMVITFTFNFIFLTKHSFPFLFLSKHSFTFFFLCIVVECDIYDKLNWLRFFSSLIFLRIIETLLTNKTIILMHTMVVIIIHTNACDSKSLPLSGRAVWEVSFVDAFESQTSILSDLHQSQHRHKILKGLRN